MLTLLGLTVSLYSMSRFVEPLLSLADSARSGNTSNLVGMLGSLTAGGGDSDSVESLLQLMVGSTSTNPGGKPVDPTHLVNSLKAIGLSDQQVALFATDLQAGNADGAHTVDSILRSLQMGASIGDLTEGAQNAAAESMRLSEAQVQSLAALLNGDLEAADVPLAVSGQSQTPGAGKASATSTRSARLITHDDGRTSIISSNSATPSPTSGGGSSSLAGRKPKEMVEPSGLPSETVVELNASAASLHAQGRLEEAIAAYHALLRTDPGSAGTHLNLAFAYYQSGDDRSAWRHVESARQLGREPHPKFKRLLSERTPDPFADAGG